MKFSAYALSILASPAAGFVNSGKDQTALNRYNGGTADPTLWVFGGDGLTVYNKDGSNVINSHPATAVCHMAAGYRGQEPSLSCSFYDVVSDGKKYVWAAVSRGVPKIDVFDINNGALVGAFETCAAPRDLEFHPLRDEIWVRCSSANDHHAYMNAFSATSPSGSSASRILSKENTTLSSYGYTTVDDSLGEVGYSTQWNHPGLFKIDLGAKEVVDEFEIPGVSGVYESAYSPLNMHIFMRSQNCCTCGFVGSDLGEDCGRYGSELISPTTGNQAGQVNVTGQCGRCDGTAADITGVIEFDTQTDSIVGYHLMKEGYGGDPFAAPSGKYIVMFGRNGGRTVRVLKPGKNGVKSTVYADVDLNFDLEGVEDQVVYNDFAFVEKDGKEMIVLASGTENRIAVITLGDSPKVDYIEFTSTTGELSSNRNRRQVEHVVGTEFVWVDGAAQDEVYVIDIEQKRLVRTITGVQTTKLVFVQNFERLAEDQQVQQTERQFNTIRGEIPEEDDDVDPVAIVAIILAAGAIIVGIANLVQIGKNKNKLEVVATKQEKAALTGEPASAPASSAVSLGSKRVN